jgi:hypothetical protein
MSEKKRKVNLKLNRCKRFFVKNNNIVSEFFYGFNEYQRKNKVFILALIIIGTIILSWFFVSKTDQTSAEPPMETSP